jgi:hypothetical protein
MLYYRSAPVKCIPVLYECMVAHDLILHQHGSGFAGEISHWTLIRKKTNSDPVHYLPTVFANVHTVLYVTRNHINKKTLIFDP